MATIASRMSSFDRNLQSIDLSKSDVNNLIMDYLITEGYPSAAEKFAAEANINLRDDETHIAKRVEIRNMVLQGRIDEAIREINELDIRLLDRDKTLHFSLLRLQLIEMIKKSFLDSDQSLVAEAIEFASQNLAPYTPLDDQFRIDLERAMALLIVPKETWSNPQAAGGFGGLAELVQPELRRTIARNVNEVILKSRGFRSTPNINFLTKARAWSEQQAREKHIPLPAKLDLGLDSDHNQSHNGQPDGGDTEMSENGAGVDPAGSDLGRYITTSS